MRPYRIALLITLVALLGCDQSSRAEPELHKDGGGALTSLDGSELRVGAAASHAPVGGVWTFGSIPLCRNTTEVPILLNLSPDDTLGGVELEALRVGTDEMSVGAVRGLVGGGLDLEEVAPLPIRSECTSGEGREIIVALRKTTSHGGGITGLRVVYELNHGLYQFVIPVSLIMCGQVIHDAFSDFC